MSARYYKATSIADPNWIRIVRTGTEEDIFFPDAQDADLYDDAKASTILASTYEGDVEVEGIGIGGAHISVHEWKELGWKVEKLYKKDLEQEMFLLGI